MKDHQKEDLMLRSSIHLENINSMGYSAYPGLINILMQKTQKHEIPKPSSIQPSPETLETEEDNQIEINPPEPNADNIVTHSNSHTEEVKAAHFRQIAHIKQIIKALDQEPTPFYNTALKKWLIHQGFTQFRQVNHQFTQTLSDDCHTSLDQLSHLIKETFTQIKSFEIPSMENLLPFNVHEIQIFTTQIQELFCKSLNSFRFLMRVSKERLNQSVFRDYKFAFSRLNRQYKQTIRQWRRQWNGVISDSSLPNVYNFLLGVQRITEEFSQLVRLIKTSLATT